MSKARPFAVLLFVALIGSIPLCAQSAADPDINQKIRQEENGCRPIV